MPLLPFAPPPSSGGGFTSPLTTKGDIHGFSSVDARIPVGSNGFPLIGDSAQTLGVGYATAAFNMNAKDMTNLTSLKLAPGTANSFLFSDGASSYASGISTVINVTGTYATAAKGVFVMDFEPTFTGGPTTVYGAKINPTVSTATVSNLYLLNLNAATGAGGAITTTRAISIGGSSLAGTTAWAVAVESTFNSYTLGRWTLGGNTTPTWNLHSMGAASATNALGVDFSTTAPTVPASNGSWAVSAYKSATPNYFILYTLNDAGTTKYLSFKITGAANGAATWTVGTSLPT